MRRWKILVLLCSVGSAGCLGESLSSDFDWNSPLPALEEVPSSALAGARIAFNRIGASPRRYVGVYWVDGATGTSGVTQTGVIDPSISPDGSRIAFRAQSLGATGDDIWIATIQGTEPRRMTDQPGSVEGPPSWTPDDALLYAIRGPRTRIVRQPLITEAPGEEIASFEPEDGQPCPIQIPGDGPVSMSGSGALVFTCRMSAIYQASSREAPALVFAKTAGMGSIPQAVWSPDGDRIAFVEWVPPTASAPGRTTIHVMSASGGSPTAIATVSQPQAMRYYDDPLITSLCWTGSGTSIIFTAPEGDLVSRVFAVAVQGGPVTRITSASGASDGAVSCSR
jgi:hypothetical protein